MSAKVPSGPGPLIWMVILFAAIAGGIWGIVAAVGVGVGVTVLFVLIGLALQKSADARRQTHTQSIQDALREKHGHQIPPQNDDIHGVFDRMNELTGGQQKEPTCRPPFTLEGALNSLMDQDAEAYARGEVPEARLVPHHAIKRDFILAAYQKDFQAHLQQLQNMHWTEQEKVRCIADANADFKKHIYGVKRLGWQDLDKIIAIMKKTRTDFRELEADVRSKGLYPFAEPL